MVTKDLKVICPQCGVVNDYAIQKLELVDSDLEVTYFCACGCRYTDSFALVYLGGRTDSYLYDRDNLKSDR